MFLIFYLLQLSSNSILTIKVNISLAIPRSIYLITYIFYNSCALMRICFIAFYSKINS